MPNGPPSDVLVAVRDALRRYRVTDPRRYARRILLLSAVLGVAAIPVSLVPAPSGIPGIPGFLYENSRIVDSVLGLLVFMSGIFFAMGITALRLWHVAVAVGFVFLAVGAYLFFLTSLYGAPVSDYGGGTSYVQVYSQPFFLAAWGLAVLLLTPIFVLALKRDENLRRSGQLLPPPPPGWGRLQ